jgi:hypothetical protein
MKSSRMRWVGHKAHTGRGEDRTEFWWGHFRGRDHLEDLGVDGGIILNWIFKDVGERAWIALI